MNKTQEMVVLYELINGSYLWDYEGPDYEEINDQITAMRKGWAWK